MFGSSSDMLSGFVNANVLSTFEFNAVWFMSDSTEIFQLNQIDGLNVLEQLF